MKRSLFLLLLAALSACDREPAKAPAAKSVEPDPASFESALSEPGQSPADTATPASLTGGKPMASPNPHARLSPEQHIAVALQHAQEGRLDQAVEILNGAIGQSPEHAGLLGARGGLLLSLDQSADVLADLERAVTLAPDSALLLVNRSQAYRRFNRLDEAMADLDRAVSLSPNLIPARFNRGVLYYGQAAYAKALADFDRCIALDAATAGPYFNRAITKDAMGDSEGAIADLTQFLRLTEDEAWVQAAEDTLRVIKQREAAKAPSAGQK
jgi:tetratricopeptide (TPR) repeat protein